MEVYPDIIYNIPIYVYLFYVKYGIPDPVWH